MNDALKSLETLCAERGMRMTEQRRVIARILEDSDDHPDVEELYRRSSKIDAKISISTVYRTVKLFEDAGIIERTRKVNGRLATKLDNNSLNRVFALDDVKDIFSSQWLKIQPVTGIKVRGYRFRVIVDDDGFVASFADCPDAVNGAIVEFNALANADRAGAENDDFLFHGGWRVARRPMQSHIVG